MEIDLGWEVSSAMEIKQPVFGSACGEQPRTFYSEDFSLYSLAPCVGVGGGP